jgi:hypothetical protein
MAEVVMILGESGSGKSASLRNFKAGEVCVLNVAGKRLPFRNDWGQNVLDASGFRDRYSTIAKAVQKPAYKRYVIDDSQYLMAFDAFDRAKETGYGKFVDMAQSFYRLIMACKAAPADTIIYFLHHIEKAEDGLIKPKTQGRMLDEKLNVAGLFTTVLLCQPDQEGYWFHTKTDGMSVVKSPMGMFDDEKIPNDLKLVDTTIRAYYGMEE